MAGVFAVGGPVFVNRVEDDLEGRAKVVLDAAGVGPVTPHFSGQEGELRCRRGPVDVPAAVIADIRGLWGVASLDLADSCVGSGDGSSADTVPSPDAVASDSVPTDQAGDPTTTGADTTTTELDLDAVPDLLANDSQFSTLRGLLGDAGLADTLAGAGPFTVFAPTNAAFEALGADVTGALGRDIELLTTVLSHHVTAGSIEAADLIAGDLDMLDGTSVTVDLGDGADGVVITSGDSRAAVAEPDLLASNGVVHAIDQVLLPPGLALGADRAANAPGADFVGGQIVLRGAVSEAQRSVLVGAAGAQVDPANVIDELVVNGATVDDGAVDGFATVISAMPPSLVTGSAQLELDGITVTGVYATAADRAAFEAALAAVDGLVVTTELTERAAADASSASALEAELNGLVAAEPILFDPSSTAISGASAATLDRVAALAAQLGAIDIVVQGHTDTDGNAQSNQALSEGRAQSVRDALIARGIAADTLTTEGFGGTRPILGANGDEDKAASRRVEFVVTATQ